MAQETTRAVQGSQGRRRPMVARDAGEHHRASTPLELLFDLCFVVAVARAGAGLHHAVAAGHVGHGLLNYVLVFFAIWWAWMNFTWFASAYDTDDTRYRLTTLVQIAGGLVVAAGIDRAFTADDYRVVVAGYVVMRLAMVTQWLRAAREDAQRRRCTLTYAGGITLVQLAWVLWLYLPHGAQPVLFFVFAAAELAVPAVAERRTQTTWHPGHIAERYGLFTLIVLGESVLSAANAIREGVDADDTELLSLIGLSVAGIVIVFGMWWLYFGQSAADRLGGGSLRSALSWGYGHYLIFGSAAAVGAGLAVAVEFDAGKLRVEHLLAAAVTTVPVAVYLLSVWLLHVGPRNECRPIALGFPVAAVLVLGVTFTPVPIHLTALVLAILVAVTVLARRTHPATTSDIAAA